MTSEDFKKQGHVVASIIYGQHEVSAAQNACNTWGVIMITYIIQKFGMHLIKHEKKPQLWIF